MNETQKTAIGIPFAIIIAGAFIAVAIFFQGSAPSSKKTVNPNQKTGIEVEAVGENDYILGTKNADLVFVEYSDTECPFCKVFHTTMHSIVDEFGKSGKVAWVYRHFPLYKPNPDGQSLHSKAGKEAEATECAAEVGGGVDAFWKYIDRLYAITPSNNRLDLKTLSTIAEEQGLNIQKFNDCLNSGKYAAKIDQEYNKALKAGASGTPYIIVLSKTKFSTKQQEKIVARVTLELGKINPNAVIPDDVISFDESGTKIMWSGALPLPVVKGIIEAAL